MNKISPTFLIYIFILAGLLSGVSCNNTKHPPESDIVDSPEELVKKTKQHIENSLSYAASHDGSIGDSMTIGNHALVRSIYESAEYAPIWSSGSSWLSYGDSLIKFLGNSKLYGLFPEDYHFDHIDTIDRLFRMDSTAKSSRRDAAAWSKADVLLTDAFFKMIKDIRLGRLPNDSISQRKDSVLSDDFLLQQLTIFRKTGTISRQVYLLEPKHPGYQSLKAGIRKFLDSADNRTFTLLPSPVKKDSVYRRLLQKRLFEGGYISFDSTAADSTLLAEGIKKFQRQKNITVDGKVGAATTRMLNMTDREKFIRIAISLDRFKLLNQEMPESYVWVNLPAYSMKLQVGDSVKLTSKIICGKTITRTPVLTSAISEIITYPQWTVPTSIIVKEILPAVKKDPGYLARKGFSLVDKNGDVVDPFSVDWSKYSKGIPFKVVQGSGDANALGVLKFNFPNKYAVYLHDTNQRYLFGQSTLTLSHGCVRVQDWQQLAVHIIKADRPSANGRYPVLDSMNAWLKRKEKHSIPIRNKLPVYIRYFTCEGADDGIVFYDDIYGEDKRLMKSHFASK
jgi:murein L,D-transpeptidase YcbB/YkuD